MISSKVLNWTVIIWLCVEGGQFVEARIPWGQNILFWPLWVSFCIVVVLGLKVVDLHYALHTPRE
jgi:hypothetical protein